MKYQNIKWLMENSEKIIIHEDARDVAEKLGKLEFGSRSKYYSFRWGHWGTWMATYTPCRSVYVYRGEGVIEFSVPGHKSSGNPPDGIPCKNVDLFQIECIALEEDENMMNAIKCMAIL